MANGISMSLSERFEAFKQSDEERQALIKELIEANQRLEGELKTAQNDHLDQLSSRRHWQDKALSAEARLKQTQDSAFDDNLIKQGAFGGGEAANRLLDNIKRHVQQYDGAIHWKIIIRIYANLEGLLKKYAYIGFVEEERSLRQFVSGFTQSQPLFDFVDVGQGKERADHKIREQLNLFATNVQCKHMLLGVAHDNGYVPTLDLYKNNQTSAVPISLLKPVNIGREYQGLPFEFVQVDSIFRSEELPNRRPIYGSQNPNMNARYPPLSPVKHNRHSSVMDGPEDIPNRRPAHANSTYGTNPRQPPLPPVNHDQHSSVTDVSRPFYPRPVFLNAYDERVDDVLELPNSRADAKLQERIRSSGKLCNDFHLKGDCQKSCGFVHEPPLEGDELLAFALRARKSPCHRGIKCRSRTCTLGHICPNGPNCSRKGTCYFKKLHNVHPEIAREYMDMD
ncbi:MAG: hypothetical protein Q9174_004206 [Haloplaca sp. 1 TL-2023]